MTRHPNVELAEASWDAVSRSDVDKLRSLWCEDLVWHVSDTSSPWFGDHAGLDAAFEYLAQVGETSDSYRIELRDILASNDHLVILSHVSTERGGRSLDADYALVGKVKGTRISELWTLPLDPEAVRDFWK